jgi:putative transposase
MPMVLRESKIAKLLILLDLKIAPTKMRKIIGMKENCQKNLRKGRFSQHNQIYRITFTTKGRKCIFDDFAKARIVIKMLSQSDEQKNSSTLAFVVMPDHIHWLVQLIGRQTLAQLIKTVKSQVTIQIGYPIWQAGYYDHAIRQDEDIQKIARYIVANPIRAGLVTKVADYPYWDAIWV